VLKFIADLFASEPTPRRASAFRPELVAMEDRYAPTVLPTNPLVIRGFNPQPEPPGIVTVNPVTPRVIIAI
jgi:hypothetical protein